MFVSVAHVLYEVALYHGVKWCKWKDMKAIIYHFPRIIEQRKEYVILFWEEDNFAKVDKVLRKLLGELKFATRREEKYP